MGKPTGFTDFQRTNLVDDDPAQRTASFDYFHHELSEDTRKEQAGRCMDCGVPFCQAGFLMDGRMIGCPLHNLIPEWNDQLWQGNLEVALSRLTRTNCFPEFTGYVCPAPCEAACSCAKVNQPVTVNANERYIIEEAFAQGLMTPQPPKRRSGMRVAVVGSGPSGLVAAALLNHRGHTVTVFERQQTPGGLLIYGIPSMKLPREVVARRIALLEAEGVTFSCGVDVGRDITVDQLTQDYDAVVLAIGAQKPRAVAFDGQASGTCFALDYLGAVAQDQLQEKKLDPLFDARGKIVAVVGAGDSANDCIATAIRQGATDILQLIRRPQTDYPPMTDYAHQEANAVFDHDIRHFQTKVAAVCPGEDGHLQALVLDTPSGQQTCAADLLVIASGFTGPEDYALTAESEAAPANLFRTGDMVLGSTLVVRAMADAHQTAQDVDTFLMGYSTII